MSSTSADAEDVADAEGDPEHGDPPHARPGVWIVRHGRGGVGAWVASRPHIERGVEVEHGREASRPGVLSTPRVMGYGTGAVVGHLRRGEVAACPDRFVRVSRDGERVLEDPAPATDDGQGDLGTPDALARYRVMYVEAAEDGACGDEAASATQSTENDDP